MEAVLIMASSFLLLAGEAIAEGLDITSGDNEQFLKLNRHQCKCVAQKMSESREVLQVLESDVGYVVGCEAEALKELYRVLTNALSLIKDCRFEPSTSKDDHHESWLRAAIAQRSYERSEDFAEICYDLQWCTLIVSITCLKSAATLQDAILVPEDCDGKLGAVDLIKLQRAANQDREDLRSNLEPLKQGHVCDDSCELSQTDSSLAAHLLERLNSSSTPTNTETLTSSLWKMDAQDIRDGNLLGAGAFGRVLKTEWLGQKHAKKVFDGQGNFKMECEVLAGLSHPHLLRVVGSSVNGRGKLKYALVMELTQEDLSEFLERTEVPLSILAALDLMLQVARGLKYLHSRRIVHRDVKSANILVAPLTANPELEYSEGCLNAKLADFGISKTKNYSTEYLHQTLNAGTRKWMAPEVFKIRQNEIDNGSMEPPDPRAHPFKADVYSFAIVCSEILTKKEPFPDVRLGGLLKHIRDGGRPELPDGCPRRLASLIKRCWGLEPRSRPDFPEICREIRYIKGLLLTGDERQHQEVDNLSFSTVPMKVTYAGLQFHPSIMSSPAEVQSIYDFVVKDIDGNDVSLSTYKGKVLLIVNVASQCGLTQSNYKELTDLYNQYKGSDFEILGFPSNQFAGQEPGSNEQIKEFACTRFKAEFPLFDKIDVNGQNQAPLYKYLKSQKGGGLFGDSITWNFAKFLVDKNGKVVERYAPTTSPSKIEKDIKKLVNA